MSGKRFIHFILLLLQTLLEAIEWRRVRDGWAKAHSYLTMTSFRGKHAHTSPGDHVHTFPCGESDSNDSGVIGFPLQLYVWATLLRQLCCYYSVVLSVGETIAPGAEYAIKSTYWQTIPGGTKAGSLPSINLDCSSREILAEELLSIINNCPPRLSTRQLKVSNDFPNSETGSSSCELMTLLREPVELIAMVMTMATSMLMVVTLLRSMA